MQVSGKYVAGDDDIVITFTAHQGLEDKSLPPYLSNDLTDIEIDQIWIAGVEVKYRDVPSELWKALEDRHHNAEFSV